jgi:hypothetical protein
MYVVKQENFRMNYLKRNSNGKGFIIKWDELIKSVNGHVSMIGNSNKYPMIPVEEFVEEIKNLRKFMLATLRKDKSEEENITINGISNISFDENGEPNKVKILAMYDTPSGASISINSTLLSLNDGYYEWDDELKSNIIRIVECAYKYIHENEVADPEIFDNATPD